MVYSWIKTQYSNFANTNTQNATNNHQNNTTNQPHNTNKGKNWEYGLITGTIATALWRGAIIWPLAYLLTGTKKWKIIGIISIIGTWNQFAIINYNLSEQTPWTGLIGLSLLYIGILGTNPKNKYMTAFLLLLLGIGSRNAIFITILFIYGTWLLLNKLNAFQKAPEIIAITCIFMTLFGTILINTGPPLLEEQTASKRITELANGEPIQNDWGLGHLLKYYDANNESCCGGPQKPFTETGWKITKQTLNCDLNEQYGAYHIYYCKEKAELNRED